MSFITHLFGGGKKLSVEGGGLWSSSGFSAHAVSGIEINPVTALTVTTALSPVSMLCEDFAKLTPASHGRNADGTRKVAEDYELYRRLCTPSFPPD